MRNWPVYLLLLLAAVGALLLLLSESEPALTARAIAQAICPTPGDSLGRDVLEQHLGGRIEVVVADTEQSTFERAELIERLVELRAAYPSCYLDLLEVEVHEGGQASLALLSGELEYSQSEAADLHAARRPFEARFRSTGKSYRLERVELGPLRRAPPEPRP
jgi:hypothetical protein